MKISLLEILQCPFCGGALNPVQDASLVMHNDDLQYGVLGCACCAYPVVAGIPVLQLDQAAEIAMQKLGAGEPEQALFALLELDEAKQAEFRVLQKKGGTYQQAIEILNHNAEGTYFVYRFSDPTYLASQAVVRAVGENIAVFPRPMLDVCGGSGHLTRTLCNLSSESEILLADTSFVKLWLAQNFTAPQCTAVCCDANNPLPFAQQSFSFVVCSDAYHYIWTKRLLANELMRLVDADGVVLLPHLHNSLQENFSAGLPLTPQHYQSLFANLNAKLLSERKILTQFLQDEPIELSAQESTEALSQEAALVLLATNQQAVFGQKEPLDKLRLHGEWRFNPLYEVTKEGGNFNLTLKFPSEGYAEEFGACTQYLPESVQVPADLLSELHAGKISATAQKLIQNFVILDVPRGYC